MTFDGEFKQIYERTHQNVLKLKLICVLKNVKIIFLLLQIKLQVSPFKRRDTPAFHQLQAPTCLVKKFL